MLDTVSGLLSQELAIDLGTASAQVAVPGRGAACREPSAVAYRSEGQGRRSLLAAGASARAMLGRTPAGIQVVRPVRDGMVADYQAAEDLLRFLLRRLGRKPVVGPGALFALGAGVTDVERRAVREFSEKAGIRRTRFIDKSICAALGAGLPLAAPEGNMVVDVGAGTVQVAVISLGGLVHARSACAAGDAMDAALVRWIEAEHGLLVGAGTAEALKLRLGAALPGLRSGYASVAGLDRERGFPRRIELPAEQVALALQPVVAEIVAAIVGALERIPPELAGDVADKGLLLCGGAAQLLGLDEAIGQRTRLPVVLAEEPMATVVAGAARALELADELGGLVSD